VRLSKGRRTDTANGPVLRWMAQDVANPLRYDWIWCWHRNQPVEATGQQDPENFEGEVQVKLSVQFTTRTNRTTGAEEQVNYYRVEEIKHA
jgi:hypothetical protein